MEKQGFKQARAGGLRWAGRRIMGGGRVRDCRMGGFASFSFFSLLRRFAFNLD